MSPVVRNLAVARRQPMNRKPTREWVQEQRLIGAITRANERLAELGLGQTVCIIYNRGAARLLSASGREMRVVEGPPALACGLLAGIVELSLRQLLSGDGEPE